MLLTFRIALNWKEMVEIRVGRGLGLGLDNKIKECAVEGFRMVTFGGTRQINDCG